MIRKVIATAAIVAGATLSTAGVASAQPVFAGGLVNIAVDDVLSQNDVNVQVPVGIAANVCGVSVAVLATLVPAPGPVDCTATATIEDIPVRFR